MIPTYRCISKSTQRYITPIQMIAPMHGQTQAFWSADKRNGREAVENRTA